METELRRTYKGIKLTSDSDKRLVSSPNTRMTESLMRLSMLGAMLSPEG